MDRQALLSNFVTATHGWGQAKDGSDCIYFPDVGQVEHHPGCAIGCQPGFREKFGDVIVEGPMISAVVNRHLEVAEFFGVEGSDDLDFLDSMQEFHDEDDNWDCKNLKRVPLRKFCDGWELTVPEVGK